MAEHWYNTRDGAQPRVEEGGVGPGWAREEGAGGDRRGRGRRGSIGQGGLAAWLTASA